MNGATIAIAAALSLIPAERQLVDRVVAVINDDIITLQELHAAAEPYLERNADAKQRKAVLESTLDNLVSGKLLAQQVVEAKITVTRSDVDRAIQDILKQNRITEQELRQAVESRGMSMVQYRDDLEAQIVRLKLVDLKVRSRVDVAEADIKAEWERQFASEKGEELLSLRHLFFRWGESPDPDEKKRVMDRAEKARGRILAGEDFAKVAAAESEGPTAANGGSLGELSRSDLLPELARAATSLKVMKVSLPVVTTNGVHVLRIDSIRRKDPPKYESKRNEIYQRLYQSETERQMKVWLTELREQSAVQIRLDG